MRILIYGINFAPELTGAGKYTGEMAEWLARRGHDVRVVTAPPYYPEWRVGEGYSGWAYRKNFLQFSPTLAPSGKGSGGVIVFRCPLWVPVRPSGLKRLVHLASFAFFSFPVVLWQVHWRPETVVAVAPTLFAAPAAWLVARLVGAPAWLHIQDFEVDVAFDMRMLRSSWAKRVFLAAERALLRRFDRVSTISQRMLARLMDKGVSEVRCVLFPNWVDITSIYPLDRPSAFRAELGLADDRVVALYAGNLGEKQGLETLIEAAAETRHEPGLLWVIAGAGGAEVRLRHLAAGLPNLRWLPLQPVERLNELLNLADIHLLPQRADAADRVMPSKLTGMLASGRPVVATAAPGTQVARVVSGCGVVMPPEDSQTLAAAVVDLAGDAGRRAALGRKAREYAERNLSYEVIMTRIEKEATSLVDGDANPPMEKE